MFLSRSFRSKTQTTHNNWSKISTLKFSSSSDGSQCRDHSRLVLKCGNLVCISNRGRGLLPVHSFRVLTLSGFRYGNVPRLRGDSLTRPWIQTWEDRLRNFTFFTTVCPLLNDTSPVYPSDSLTPAVRAHYYVGGGHGYPPFMLGVGVWASVCQTVNGKNWGSTWDGLLLLPEILIYLSWWRGLVSL